MMPKKLIREISSKYGYQRLRNYRQWDDVHFSAEVNGVEIFEGDVVKWGDTLGGEETPIRIAVVKINPDIQFDSNVGIFNYGQFAYKNTEKFLTILGNIYEDKGLLEARK